MNDGMQQMGATPALSQSSSTHLDVTSPIKFIGRICYFASSKPPMLTWIVQTGLGTRLEQLCLMMEDFKMLSEDETVKLLAEKERTQKCQQLFKELPH